MISTKLFIVLSGALTFGVPLVWAFFELRAVQRPTPRAKPDGGIAVLPDAPSPAPQGGEPPLPPLPDCLIPKLSPEPVRPRELV